MVCTLVIYYCNQVIGMLETYIQEIDTLELLMASPKSREIIYTQTGEDGGLEGAAIPIYGRMHVEEQKTTIFRVCSHCPSTKDLKGAPFRDLLGHYCRLKKARNKSTKKQMKIMNKIREVCAIINAKGGSRKWYVAGCGYQNKC